MCLSVESIVRDGAQSISGVTVVRWMSVRLRTKLYARLS
jgi:hypothetical protein